MQKIVEVQICHTKTLAECKKCPSFKKAAEMAQGGKNYYCTKY
jgi:hypothetical protein